MCYLTLALLRDVTAPCQICWLGIVDPQQKDKTSIPAGACHIDQHRADQSGQEVLKLKQHFNTIDFQDHKLHILNKLNEHILSWLSGCVFPEQQP